MVAGFSRLRGTGVQVFQLTVDCLNSETKCCDETMLVKTESEVKQSEAMRRTKTAR